MSEQPAAMNFANHVVHQLVDEDWSYLEIVVVAVAIIDQIHDECPQAVVQFRSLLEPPHG
jgi:hypothetical protein